MQIVINIPQKLYKELTTVTVTHAGEVFAQKLIRYIKNGILLPKGHGKLIDADAFLKDNETYTGWILYSSDWGGENPYKDTLEDLINEAHTIIEADCEVKDGNNKV